MDGFSPTSMVHFGWEVFKKRPWFLVGAPLLLYAGVGVVNAMLSEIGKIGPVLALVTVVTTLTVEICANMGMTAFLLKAHDDVAGVRLADLWHVRPFWKFTGTILLQLLFVVAGLLLFVVPGVVLLIALLFSTYAVIDRELGPVEALKESARITKGHRWDLFVFLLLILALNIAGVLALLVGLLITAPVTSLAIVHAYRTLSAREAPASAEVSNG